MRRRAPCCTQRRPEHSPSLVYQSLDKGGIKKIRHFKGKCPMSSDPQASLFFFINFFIRTCDRPHRPAPRPTLRVSYGNYLLATAHRSNQFWNPRSGLSARFCKAKKDYIDKEAEEKYVTKVVGNCSSFCFVSY